VGSELKGWCCRDLSHFVSIGKVAALGSSQERTWREFEKEVNIFY